MRWKRKHSQKHPEESRMNWAMEMGRGEAREERRLKRPRKYMGTKRDQDCTEPK